MTTLKPLSKSELRQMARDYIDVGTKLPNVQYVPEREEGPSAWYVVMTNPRCEARAQSGLIDKGFAVYLPQYKLERLLGRKGKTARAITSRTLFPRYMFVRAPFGSWPRITSTDGIQGLVRDCGVSGRPLSVSDQAVAMLLDHQNAGAFDELLDPEKQPKGRAKKMQPPFSDGEKVRVLDGPFKDFMATVVRAIAGHSADILVEILGHLTPVNIDIAQIRKA